MKTNTINTKVAALFVGCFAIDGKGGGSMMTKHQALTPVTEDQNRTIDQNKAQWPILAAFSRQLKWPVNGEMVYMSPEEWKDVLTAAYKNETVRLAMGLNGGVVMLGKRTSKFGKKEFGEWLEFLNSVAAERGVKIPVSKRDAARYGYQS